MFNIHKEKVANVKTRAEKETPPSHFSLMLATKKLGEILVDAASHYINGCTDLHPDMWDNAKTSLFFGVDPNLVPLHVLICGMDITITNNGTQVLIHHHLPVNPIFFDLEQGMFQVLHIDCGRRVDYDEYLVVIKMRDISNVKHEMSHLFCNDPNNRGGVVCKTSFNCTVEFIR